MLIVEGNQVPDCGPMSGHCYSLEANYLKPDPWSYKEYLHVHLDFSSVSGIEQ